VILNSCLLIGTDLFLEQSNSSHSTIHVTPKLQISQFKLSFVKYSFFHYSISKSVHAEALLALSEPSSSLAAQTCTAWHNVRVALLPTSFAGLSLQIKVKKVNH